jgi:TRAP-type C4-dicarboxylate transport system permease small subunit
MKRLNTIFDGIIDSLAFIAGFFIFCMIMIECAEIFARYFLGKPLIWTYEAIEYMLYLVGFLGAAWLLKEKGHVAVSLLVDCMKSKTRIYLRLLVSLIGTIISLIIIWFGLISTWDCYVGHVTVVKTHPLPKYIFLIFIPIGYVLLAVEFMRQFFSEIRKLGLERTKGKG